MDDVEVPLAGGNMGPVVRRGDDVLRVSGAWTPAVHRLLTHCRTHGFDQAPQPRGITDDHREILQFLPGDVPQYPMPAWVWTEATLDSCAELLRRFHDVSQSASRVGPWRSPIREPVEVVCHNDFAPYNIVFTDGRATGVIDFDHASPGPRIWDLAYLAYRIVPLTGDRSDGFDDDQRSARLHRLLDQYRSAASVDQLLQTVIIRLEALAEFSDAKAAELGRPELADHALGYRGDADQLRAWRTGA